MVFSAGISVDRAREISPNRPQQRPRRHGRLPVRSRRRVTGRHLLVKAAPQPIRWVPTRTRLAIPRHADRWCVLETHDRENEAYEKIMATVWTDYKLSAVYVSTVDSPGVFRALKDLGWLGTASVVTTDLFPELAAFIQSGAVAAICLPETQIGRSSRRAIRFTTRYFQSLWAELGWEGSRFTVWRTASWGGSDLQSVGH
jgi:hypothetical protein